MISSVAEIKEDRDKVAGETRKLQNYVLLTPLNMVSVWELTHTHIRTHTHTNISPPPSTFLPFLITLIPPTPDNSQSYLLLFL